jgi:hypothetical protein
MYDAAVVGGGLSGMIAALELATVGERVVLYEAQPRLGGVVASWASYGDVYTNLQDVVARIGQSWPTVPERVTALPRVPFQIPTKGDVETLLRLLRAMTSLSLDKYRKMSWDEGLSPWGKMASGKYIGRFYAKTNVITVARHVEMTVAHQAMLRISPLSTTPRPTFRVSPLPAQEYLIDPLHRMLEELGVDIRLNHPVTSLSPALLHAQTTVSTIPPHAYAKISDTSGVHGFAVKKMAKLAAEMQHQQISFQMDFPRFLPEMATVDLHESPWRITLSSTHTEMTGSVWSGACDANHPDKAGRLVTESSMTQFRESLLDQILECTDFVEAFAKAGENIRELLLDSEIYLQGKWTEGPNGTLESPDVILASSCGESWLRPAAGSKIGPHVFLAGAHARTGSEMWSMESAAEAGKRAAIAVLENKGKHAAAASIFLDNHPRHPMRFVLFLGGIATLVVGLLLLHMY